MSQTVYEFAENKRLFWDKETNTLHLQGWEEERNSNGKWISYAKAESKDWVDNKIFFDLIKDMYWQGYRAGSLTTTLKITDEINRTLHTYKEKNK